VRCNTTRAPASTSSATGCTPYRSAPSGPAADGQPWPRRGPVPPKSSGRCPGPSTARASGGTPRSMSWRRGGASAPVPQPRTRCTRSPDMPLATDRYRRIRFQCSSRADYQPGQETCAEAALGNGLGRRRGGDDPLGAPAVGGPPVAGAAVHDPAQHHHPVEFLGAVLPGEALVGGHRRPGRPVRLARGRPLR
jgi:hypothetical protein